MRMGINVNAGDFWVMKIILITIFICSSLFSRILLIWKKIADFDIAGLDVIRNRSNFQKIICPSIALINFHFTLYVMSKSANPQLKFVSIELFSLWG